MYRRLYSGHIMYYVSVFNQVTEARIY